MRPLLDLRSFLDTRGGVITMIIGALLTLGAEAIGGLAQPWLMPDAAVTAYGPLIAATLPLTVVLPVLAVLMIASDWSNQSIQTTFLHRPHRGAVLGSKVIATLLLSIIQLLVAIAGIFAFTAIGGIISSHGADYSSLADSTASPLVQLAASLAFGIAMACLLQSTALALIASIAVPFVVGTISSLVTVFGGETVQHLVALVDLSTASILLVDGGFGRWNAGAFVIMLLLPLVAGTLRWRSREIA